MHSDATYGHEVREHIYFIYCMLIKAYIILKTHIFMTSLLPLLLHTHKRAHMARGATYLHEKGFNMAMICDVSNQKWSTSSVAVSTTHILTGHKYKSTYVHTHLLVKSAQSQKGEHKSEAQKLGRKAKPLLIQMCTNVLTRPAKMCGVKENKQLKTRVRKVVVPTFNLSGKDVTLWLIWSYF